MTDISDKISRISSDKISRIYSPDKIISNDNIYKINYSQKNQSEIASSIISKNINQFKKMYNKDIHLTHVEVDGNTLLMIAVKHKSIDIFKLLIADGANTNIKNRENDTALDIAIKNYNSSTTDSEKKTTKEYIDILLQNNTLASRNLLSKINNEKLKRYYFKLQSDKVKWIEQSEETLNDPITLETFIDPLIASSGITYSRETLEKIFKTDKKCPITREMLVELNGKIGIPNILINSLVEKHNEFKINISQGGNLN